jgi:hypothetical protein
VAHLQEFRDSDAYDAFRFLVEAEAQLRAQRLLKPSTLEESNFERGVLYGFRHVYDVVDRTLEARKTYAKLERQRDERPDTTGPAGQFWGSDHFRDFWK